MAKLRKKHNKSLVILIPVLILVVFAMFLTYSFANFKIVKIFDIVAANFNMNSYTLSYDVQGCTSKTVTNNQPFGELCVPAIPDGYTFDGWYYNDELIESTTQVHTNQNIQLLAHFTQNNSCVIGTTYDFDYTGDVQQFTASCPGKYRLETWGAQGGTVLNDIADNNNIVGGYGGYATGVVNLLNTNTLYVFVGEHGPTLNYDDPVNTKYAYPNGGAIKSYNDGHTIKLNGGGGSTHISLTNKLIKDIAKNSSDLLIVSGGGGGVANFWSDGDNGGSGGGFIGGSTTVNYNNNNTTGGTQTAAGLGGGNVGSHAYADEWLAGAYGIGGGLAYDPSQVSGGGGGGYYGGGASWGGSGGGGSGYVGNSSLYNKHMTCYNCTTDNNVDTKTISNTCHNANPTVDCSKEGNGYARITYLGNVTEFAYNGTSGSDGSVQVYTVPMTGLYKIELWGAGNISNVGGAGYTSGLIRLNANENLYFYVGGYSTGCRPYHTCDGTGYNGGGAGGYFTTSNYPVRVYGGGGATDVRYFGNTTPSDSDLVWNSALGLNSRIMVAGGGSGGGAQWGGSGVGGGLTGYTGTSTSSNSAVANGTGGSQVSGGTTSGGAQVGSFGKGGYGYISDPLNPNGNDGFGGGGGYYGGGGGTGGTAGANPTHRGFGGGGSSYISGYPGCIAISEGAINNPRTIKTGCTSSSTSVECSKHYSGLYFSNPVMIDGKGCNWSTGTATNCGANQPQPDGTTTAGHNGNGYARITYLPSGGSN